MVKKILALLLACMLLCTYTLPLSASAAQSSNMIQDVTFDGTELRIVCSQVEAEGEWTVKADGNVLTTFSRSVGELRTPITVFCLVDICGSFSGYKMRILKDALMEISNSLGSDDSMVIAQVNDQFTMTDPLYLAEERETMISQITADVSETGLYNGIVKSIGLLSSDERYNPARCLVVLSYGSKHNRNVGTEQEVISAIQAAPFPVYTVALVEKYSEREGGKVLGSFARASSGGRHFTTVDEEGTNYVLENASGTQFGSEIWTSVQGTQVVIADLSQTSLDLTKPTVEVQVRCQAGNNVYEQTLSLSSSLFPVIEEEVPETTKSRDSEKETEDTYDYDDYEHSDDCDDDYCEGECLEQEETDYTWWIVGGCGAAAVIILAVVLVILSRKKKQRQEQPPRTQPVEPVKPNVSEPPKAQPEGKRYNVFVTDIPYGNLKLRFTIQENQTATFGRDKRANFILNPKDSNLSGKHFAVIVTENRYCIRDEGSTNGTFLNGVPLANKGWTILQNSDKIRAGGYEYRIMIE